VVPAGEPFPNPLVVRVLDPNGAPLAGGTVNFNVSGGATLSTTNPVIADPNGYARTNATATIGGGMITVNASTPGGDPGGTTIGLFARKINLIGTPSLIVLTIANTTTAVPAVVPMIVFVSAPGIPALSTPIGPICTNPYSALTFVLEDSIGAFGFYSFSGTGAVGTPGLTKIYNIPGGLSGVTLNFQAVGLDPVAGPFRTNCQLKTF
jgi:Bacterial Ig-like domain (group 1)